jgi:hypothetical protein
MIFLKAFKPSYFKSLVDELAKDKEAREVIPGAAMTYSTGWVLVYFAALISGITLLSGGANGLIYAGLIFIAGYLLLLFPCVIARSACSKT